MLLGYGGLPGTWELVSVRRLPSGPQEQGEMVGPASGQNPRAGAHSHVGSGGTWGAPLPRTDGHKQCLLPESSLAPPGEDLTGFRGYGRLHCAKWECRCCLTSGSSSFIPDFG